MLADRCCAAVATAASGADEALPASMSRAAVEVADARGTEPGVARPPNVQTAGASPSSDGDADGTEARAALSRVGSVSEAPLPGESPLPATMAVTSSTPTPNRSQHPTPTRSIGGERSQRGHDVEAFPVGEYSKNRPCGGHAEFWSERFLRAAGPHACVTPVLLHRFVHRLDARPFPTSSRSA
jgi:hypothetical protein